MKRNTGEKIKNIRQMKDLTLAELAKKTNMTAEMVESVENGTELPSLTPLIKIARAMGVRLGTFLDDTEVQGPVLTRKDHEKKAKSFSSKTSSSHPHMDFVSLAKDKSGRHMEPFIVDIQPVKEENYVFSSHEGEEFIYVLEGEIEISYGKESYILSAGDSIYYDSIVKHNVHCKGDSSAKVLAVVYAPF